MKRKALALASLAVATIACLVVMRALRQTAGGAAAPASMPAAARPAPEVAAAPGPRDAALAPRAPAPPPVDADSVATRARAAEAAEQALRDAILHVGADATLPLDARLERYREALRDAQAAAPDAPIFAYPSMLAEVFLRMEPVQRDLAAQSPAARARTLAHIRRELGFDDEAIARMEAIDAQREARWQNGLAYMQERARVAASFEGHALAAELRALRENWFGDEAGTIEAEEHDGFFRFERPRIYGRN
jgi:hypothetical protein